MNAKIYVCLGNMEHRSYWFWKRLLDIGLSVLLLLPFLALGLLVGTVSLWVFRNRLFFTQPRLGYRHNIFRIYKFTTLLPEKVNGYRRSPDERQTAWGRFMRDYSLDELPQLLNILKGDMSFVGPRPLLPEYESLYSMAEARRHLVRPGLTGLAQVNGRNALDWGQKMQFDQQYVEALSFHQDLHIMMRTFAVILRGQEVNYGTAPVPAAVDEEMKKQPQYSPFGVKESPQMQWKQA